MTNILYSYHNPGFAVRDVVITTHFSVSMTVGIINSHAGWLIGLAPDNHTVAWIPVHCISRVWDDSAGETVKIVDFVAGGDRK